MVTLAFDTSVFWMVAIRTKEWLMGTLQKVCFISSTDNIIEEYLSIPFAVECSFQWQRSYVHKNCWQHTHTQCKPQVGNLEEQKNLVACTPLEHPIHPRNHRKLSSRCHWSTPPLFLHWNCWNQPIAHLHLNTLHNNYTTSLSTQATYYVAKITITVCTIAHWL